MILMKILWRKFDLYKKVRQINDIENPNINSLEKLISINPKEGRLVIFKNETMHITV